MTFNWTRDLPSLGGGLWDRVRNIISITCSDTQKTNSIVFSKSRRIDPKKSKCGNQCGIIRAGKSESVSTRRRLNRPGGLILSCCHLTTPQFAAQEVQVYVLKLGILGDG